MKTVSLDQLAEEPFIGYSTDRYLLDLQLRALALHGVHPQRLYSAEPLVEAALALAPEDAAPPARRP